MYNLIAAECGLPCFADMNINQNGSAIESKILSSLKGYDVINALSTPSSFSIADVPVDAREYCKVVFERNLTRPMIEDRVAFTGTASFTGAGKTVMIYFNCAWFVEKSGRIAVIATFNDDQSALWKGVDTDGFQQAIAVRIAHRIIQHYTGIDNANKLKMNNNSISKAVISMSNPIEGAIRLLKWSFGAPDSTEVLLCIDELKSALSPPPPQTKPTQNVSASTLLRCLTTILDQDKTLFLSVAAYGAIDVTTLATDSKRPFLLQPLGPLWFTKGMESEAIPLLPTLLQPFYQESLRIKMPSETTDRTLYDDISHLLLTTGGHGRRVQQLFKCLKEIDTLHPNLLKLATYNPRKFNDVIRTWLYHEVGVNKTRKDDILAKVREVTRFPTDFSLLTKEFASGEFEDLSDEGKVASIAKAIERLAIDAACSFELPQSSTLLQVKHYVTLKGTEEGYSQLLNCRDDVSYRDLFHAFIPLAVLNAHVAHPEKMKPCGEALFMLRDAINAMHISKHGDGTKCGKDLEAVALYSMLLFARSNDSIDGFSIKQLCAKHQHGSRLNDVNLKGGGKVKVWHCKKFPTSQDGKLTAVDVQKLINKLGRSTAAPGGFLFPSNQWNKPSDFYGVFKTIAGGYVVLRVQAKDWFRQLLRSGETVEESWRKYDAGCPASVTLADGTVVPVISLLFTSNEMENFVTVQPNEGIITINAMRDWLPTAAHALQTATHLRKIFDCGEPKAE